MSDEPTPTQDVQPEHVGAGDPRWEQTGLTYRQQDYWTKLGYLQAVQATPGSGARRLWPVEEIAVAARMVAWIRAGTTVARAAELARAGVDVPAEMTGGPA